MSSSFFLDDNTALTLPAIPKRDWMGQGEGEAVRGQRPASIVPLRVWSMQCSCTTPELVPSSRRQGQKRINSLHPSPPHFLHKPSQQTSNHTPPRPPSFLVSKPESSSSFSLPMVVKNTSEHVSMQQPSVCSASALYSWLMTHKNSP